MKKGILLVAFGTSVPQGRAAYEMIDEMARERFDGTDIRWAYTSSFIRRKLAREGEQYDSPLVALGRMRDEGYTHVAVQSLHIAPGAEFHDLAATVRQFRAGPNAFESIRLGPPLLSRERDVERVTTAVLNSLPKRGPKDAVVLMGHGNEHGDGELALVAAAAKLQLADPLAFFGTVEGEPSTEDVLEQCRKHEPERAFLVPFLTVAGDHARNDLAGDEPDSWKSRISALGIECVPVLKGLGENKNVVAIWMDHLQTAVEAVEK